MSAPWQTSLHEPAALVAPLARVFGHRRGTVLLRCAILSAIHPLHSSPAPARARAEQLRFYLLRRYASRRFKTALPGPSLVTPVIGVIGEMMADPEQFWNKQRAFAPCGMSPVFLSGHTR